MKLTPGTPDAANADTEAPRTPPPPGEPPPGPSNSGQVFRLLIGLVRRPADPRKSNDQILAKAPDRVVGSPRLDRSERQLRDRRELGAEELTDDVRVDVELLGVHPHGGRRQAAATSATRSMSSYAAGMSGTRKATMFERSR